MNRFDTSSLRNDLAWQQRPPASRGHYSDDVSQQKFQIHKHDSSQHPPNQLHSNLGEATHHDDEHHKIFDGLLYSSQQDSLSYGFGDFDFFEEDYKAAQAAIANTASPLSTYVPFNRRTENYNFSNQSQFWEERAVYERIYVVSSIAKPFSEVATEKVEERL